jgi:ABC-2 type transport system permease protein
MRLYYEIALRSFRRATVYRSSYIAGILTNAFFGVLRSFVYIGLYGAGGAVAGFTLQDAISYTWVTQALISIGAGWVFSRELMGSIRTGDVVTDLSRPWNFYGYWLSQSLGERCFNLLVRGTLTYLIGVMYFGAARTGAAQWLGFVAAIGLALVLSFAFSFIVNMSAFWLLESSGVMMVANIMLSFFSGFLLPIAFFPAPLAALARALPFQAITGVPAQIFLGQIGGAGLARALLLQLGWSAALVGLGLLLLRAAMRKVVVQGG